jgi:hypothetical protein
MIRSRSTSEPPPVGTKNIDKENTNIMHNAPISLHMPLQNDLRMSRDMPQKEVKTHTNSNCKTSKPTV